jgi:mannan endo-1,6-alpha-mannosidase
VNGLLTQLIEVFFPNGVAIEIACEAEDVLTCNTDMLSFKGYVHRWMAVTAQLAPFTKSRITEVLRTSAQAAINQCKGGANGRLCGFRWAQSPEYDGSDGAGQQMNVLGALTSLLFTDVPGPLTRLTGGTSEGDYSAGSSPAIEPPREITASDKAGAGILTILLLVSVGATFTWMSTGFYEGYIE